MNINLEEFREPSYCCFSYSHGKNEVAVGKDLGMVGFSSGKDLHVPSEWTPCDSTIYSLALKKDGSELVFAAMEDEEIVGNQRMRISVNKAIKNGEDKVDGSKNVTVGQEVTKIQYSNDDKFIFISSMEPDINVYSSKLESSVRLIQTNDIGVRTFEICPNGEYIALMNTQGDLSIRNLRRDNGSLNDEYTGSDSLKTAYNIAPNSLVRNIGSIGCKLSWNPRDDVFQVATPSKGANICLFTKCPTDEYDWEERSILVHDDESGADVNLVGFSPNGAYLAVSDVIGRITIYNMMTTPISPVRSIHVLPASPLHDMCWGQRKGDNFLFVLSATSKGRLDVAVPLEAGAYHPTGPLVPIEKTNVRVSLPIAGASAASKSDAKAMSRLVRKSNAGADDDDEDFAPEPEAASESVSEIRKRTLGIRPESGLHDGAYANDDNDDDDYDGMVDDDAIEVDERAITAISNLRAPVVPLQPAFQPSATAPDDKKRRYLVWNHVGTVVSREESLNSRIEIKFSNSAGSNKQEAFTDLYGFTKAALSYEGAFFANDPEEPENDEQRDDPNFPGSVVFYRGFPGQRSVSGMNEDFTTTLPKDEAAQAVAVGAGWAAVATSKKYLRIFSSTGLQLAVLWLRGPVLCMAGSRERLAVVSHSTSVGADTPHPVVDIFELVPGTTSIRLISQTAVPVSTGATLTWAGWAADADYLAVMDSAGVLSVLLRVGGWNWVPVLDCPAVRRHIDHQYWPICIKSQKLIYVLLNGENKPAVHPQPVVSNVDFAPLVVLSREGKDKGLAANTRAKRLMWDTMKAEHIVGAMQDLPDSRAEALYQTCLDYEREADVAVLTAFAEACRSRRDAIALDLGRRLRSTEACGKAIEIANRVGRQQIATYLDTHLAHLEEAKQQQEQQVNELDQTRPEDDYDDENVDLSNNQHTAAGNASDGAGALSRRLSDRYETSQLNPTQSRIPSTIGPSSAVKAAAPRNPFLKSSPLSPDKKRKSVSENLTFLAGSSPSPKRPSLSRTSALAKEARTNRLQDKTIL